MDPLIFLAAKGAQALAGAAGERLGGPAGDLCRSVADKFKGDSYARQTLARAQDKPDSNERLGALQEVLAEKMQSDPDFAKRMEKLVGEAQKEGSRLLFDQRGQTVHGPQTNIAGGVQGSVFSGNFNGPVAQGGDANDFRGSVGTIFRPAGPVDQQIGDRYYYIQKPEEIPRLPFVPDPPLDFTGRNEELQELLAKFADGTKIIGLRGIAGVGKTALALKLIESIKDSYPDGQIMVDMMGTTDPISPSDAMAFVIRSYHREEKMLESEAEVRRRYLEVLNGKRALLLLDNASDDKQVLKLIPPKSCGLIITSRKTIMLPGLVKKDLDVMKPAEAMDLLLKICCAAADQEKAHRDDPAWPEITRLCGFLPLALRAAGSYLANSDDVSPAKYAMLLKDERTRLEMIGEQGVEMSVDASLGLSFERLEPKVQQTFLYLSVFPADFDAQAEEQICLDEGHKGLSELLRWSLVDYKPQSPDYGRYKMHDLVRLFAAEKLLADPGGEAARNEAGQRHAQHFKGVLSLATKLYLNRNVLAALKVFDLEKMNIDSAWAWAKENLALSEDVAFICSAFLNAPYLLELRQHPRERISWLETALAAARRLKNKRMEGVHLGNLGSAYYRLGEARKAIDYYELALFIDREIEDRRGEGADLGNLGNAYNRLGEARKAIKYHEQALAIMREIEDQRGEGAEQGNLGLAYAALGDARKAIEYYEQALVIAREIGDRRGEGNVLCNLGNSYADLGDARKAIEYNEHALAIDREIGDRRGEGNTLGSLGNAYAALGESRKALKYHERYLSITREIGDRRGEGIALFNMSIAQYGLGKRFEAKEMATEALAIFEQIESPYAEQVRQQLAKWKK